MAIYSLHHQPIGKTTQARAHTAAAHVRYITRPSAASRIEAARMPDKPGRAATFMRRGEDGDRKNARVADKLMLALPRELDAEQRAQLVKSFAEEVTQGRAPWLAAFHDKGKDHQNPHAHLLIRDRDPDTGKRVSGLSDNGSTERLRQLWETHANRALERGGHAERIDRRTLKAQGIERLPTIHEGPKAQQMDRRGARPESRVRMRRNAPGARSAARQVDYQSIDRGRSRPAYNRCLRETTADYWQAFDAANQAHELEQLRALHHRPDSVIIFSARRPIPHGVVNQHPVNPGVPLGDFSGVRGAKRLQTGLLSLVPPARDSEKSAPHRIADIASHDEILEPSERAAEKPAKPVEQNINHGSIIGNKILERKGNVMGVDDDEKRRRIADLGDARAREDKSRAARDNALEKGYMRPDLAGPSIDKFYKNKGVDKLKDKFQQFAGPSEFGVKRGNPLTKEGRAKRADANQARRSIPDLWDKHDKDAKNREASERAFSERYGPSEGQAPISGQTPPSGRGVGGGAAGGQARPVNPQPQQATERPSAPEASRTPQPAYQAGHQPQVPQSPQAQPAQVNQDRQNNDAVREARERLAREQNPAYAKSAEQPKHAPEPRAAEMPRNPQSTYQTEQPQAARSADQRPQQAAHPAPVDQDRKNNDATREAKERLAREQNPAYAKSPQAAEPQQQGRPNDDARRQMMDQMRDRQAKEKELEKQKGKGMGIAD